MTVSAAGYATLTQQATVVVGVSTTVNAALSTSTTPTTSTTGTIAGQVSSVNDGHPLSGATVQYANGSVTADGHGNFSIPNLAAGAYNLNVSSPGFLPRLYPVSVTGGATTQVAAQLSVAGVLAGTITANGNAVPGASVQVQGGAVPVNLAITSNAAGSYYSGWIPVGNYTFTVSAPGYATQTVAATVNTGLTTTTNIALSTSTTVTTGSIVGHVTTSSGSPLQDATVTTASATAVTDVNGAYTLANLSATTQQVTASLAEYGASTQTVAVTAGASTSLNFVLSPNVATTGSLSGTVTNLATSGGIAGATVSYAGGSVVANGMGQFTFSNLAAGTYSMTATANGYLSRTFTVNIVGGTNPAANFQLSTAGTLGGTVTSGGLPLAGATVTITGGMLPTTAQVLTGSTGTYYSNWIPIGSYTVSVSKSGYTTQTVNSNVNVGVRTTLDFSF